MVWKQGASPVYDQSNNAGRQREIRRREVVSMSVRRIMGTETEYAVSALGMEHYNPVKLSFDVVGAAANEQTKHIRWDYRQEDPVNDARGTRLERASAHPDLLTDAPQLNITNVIAVNGGRVYVDHAHPEYSAPETDDPFDAVLYDHAGDLIMRECARKASEQTGIAIALHRNNVDGKGASWGTHDGTFCSETDFYRIRSRRYRRTKRNRRIPAQPARRLFSYESRFADHIRQADHQYSRRIAQHGCIPSIACDCRGRQSYGCAAGAETRHHQHAAVAA